MFIPGAACRRCEGMLWLHSAGKREWLEVVLCTSVGKHASNWRACPCPQSPDLPQDSHYVSASILLGTISWPIFLNNRFLERSTCRERASHLVMHARWMNKVRNATVLKMISTPHVTMTMRDRMLAARAQMAQATRTAWADLRTARTRTAWATRTALHSISTTS